MQEGNNTTIPSLPAAATTLPVATSPLPVATSTLPVGTSPLPVGTSTLPEVTSTLPAAAATSLSAADAALSASTAQIGPNSENAVPTQGHTSQEQQSADYTEPSLESVQFSDDLLRSHVILESDLPDKSLVVDATSLQNIYSQFEQDIIYPINGTHSEQFVQPVLPLNSAAPLVPRNCWGAHDHNSDDQLNSIYKDHSTKSYVNVTLKARGRGSDLLDSSLACETNTSNQINDTLNLGSDINDGQNADSSSHTSEECTCANQQEHYEIEGITTLNTTLCSKDHEQLFMDSLKVVRDCAQDNDVVVEDLDTVATFDGANTVLQYDCAINSCSSFVTISKENSSNNEGEKNDFLVRRDAGYMNEDLQAHTETLAQSDDKILDGAKTPCEFAQSPVPCTTFSTSEIMTLINANSQHVRSLDDELLELFSQCTGTSTCRLNSDTRVCDSQQYNDMQNSPGDQMTFSELPVEIVMLIFSYLSSQELGKTVAQVCKTWRDYAYDPTLWEVLAFKFSCNIDSSCLCEIFTRAPLLKELSLQGRKELDIVETHTLATMCPQLQHLDLGFCEYLNLKIVTCIAEHCRNLCSLNLEGSGLIEFESIKQICSLPKLTHLNLTHCSRLEDNSILWIVQHMEKIISLNLDGVSWITDKSVRELLQHHTEMKCLQLDGEGLSDRAFNKLPACEHLQKFTVSFAELLTDDTLYKLESLHHLKHLKLKKGTEFTSEGLSRLFHPGHLNKLTVLDLSECNNIKDDCVISLAQGCKSSLQRLSLCWCWEITDVGLKAIVDNCSHLVYMDLLGIDKIRGECLQDIPQKMPKLIYLDLQQCHKIIDELVLSVVHVKKDLTILNYYGEEFSLLSDGTSPSGVSLSAIF